MSEDTVTPIHLTTTTWGSGSPRLVLIHGMGDGAFVWDELVSQLRVTTSGVTVDLRGHGDSPWDSLRRYNAATHAMDVAVRLQEMNLTGLTLIGHSLGADIAIRLAAAQTFGVERLILIDGGPDLEEHAAWALREQMGALRRHYDSPAEFEQLLGDLHPFANASVLHRYAHSALRANPSGGFELKCDPAIWETVTPPDTGTLWAALERSPVPKLLVRGAASAFLPLRRALNVSRRLPHCQVASVSRAGHAVPLHNPSGVHAAITNFLAETSPSHRASAD